MLNHQAVRGQDIVYGQTSRQLPNGQGCVTDAGTFVITRPRRRSNYTLIPRPGLLLEMTPRQYLRIVPFLALNVFN
jgi:hypothetical protein